MYRLIGNGRSCCLENKRFNLDRLSRVARCAALPKNSSLTMQHPKLFANAPDDLGQINYKLWNS